MATVTPPRSANLVPVHAQLRSPLQQIRKYIRAYVSIEGVLVFLLFLALWFWIGLLLDYGAYAIVGWDWVRIMPTWLRTVLLVGLASGAVALAAVKVLTRLFKDFKDSSLALILERRFPKVLGDRLITAVELSDPEACAALGFSPAMVRETIHEAAERVQQVPVREVFDWRRLRKRLLVLLALTFVVTGFVLGGFCFFGKTAAHGYYKFRNVSAIWFERNILLMNSYWPRRTFLIVLEPSAPEQHIYSDDADKYRLGVLALKYVLADPQTEEGWRALSWKDLELRSELIGSKLPAPPPAYWKPQYGILFLTEKESFEPLRADGVPDAVLAKLKPLKDVAFEPGQRLETKIVELLGKADAKEYKDRILARVHVSITLDEVKARLDRFDVRHKADGEKMPAKWNINFDQKGWRPLTWKDVTKDVSGELSKDLGTASTRFAYGYMLGLDTVPNLFGDRYPKDPNLTDPEMQVAQIAGLCGSGANLAPFQAACKLSVIPFSEFLPEAIRRGLRSDAARIGAAGFSDNTLDTIEARLAKKSIDDELHFSYFNRPLIATYGSQVTTFDGRRVAQVAATSFGLRGFSGTAILTGFAEWKIASSEIHVVLQRLEHLTELREVVEQVAQRADDPAMGRTLRELVLPNKVTLVFKSDGAGTATTETDLKNCGVNVFTLQAGEFPKLKLGTTDYVARADDAVTATRSIIVEPSPPPLQPPSPPLIVDFYADQFHPAYLYYRPDRLDTQDLEALRQDKAILELKEKLLEAMKKPGKVSSGLPQLEALATIKTEEDLEALLAEMRREENLTEMERLLDQKRESIRNQKRKELRGVKQPMAERVLSAGSSGVVFLSQVPAGSDLVLRGKIDHKLKNSSFQKDVFENPLLLLVGGTALFQPLQDLHEKAQYDLARNPAVQIVPRDGSVVLPLDFSWYSEPKYKLTRQSLGKLRTSLLAEKKDEDVVAKLENRLLALKDQEFPNQAQFTAQLTEILEGTTFEPFKDAVLNYAEKTSFEFGFKNLREAQKFTIVFIDADGVKGERFVEISPKSDSDPVVEAFEPDTVRKTTEGYKITANARIPFRGIVQDGQGLARVRYAYTLVQDKIGSEAAKANTVVIFGLTLKLPTGDGPINNTDVRYRDVPAFVRAMNADYFTPGRAYLSPSLKKEMLGQEQPSEFRKLVTRFTIAPDDWIKPLNPTDPRAEWRYPKAKDEKQVPLACDFPVWELIKSKAGPNKVELHYTMRFWVEVMDTDIEGDVEKDGTPRSRVVATTRVTFKIVPEDVLIAAIDEEEEELRKRFKDLLESLRIREDKLGEIHNQLSSGNIKDPKDGKIELENELNGMIGSLSVSTGVLGKAKSTVSGVRKDYERILKELRVNQVELANRTNEVDKKIVEPLIEIEAEDFPAAVKSLADLSTALDKAKVMNNVADVTGSTRASADEAKKRIRELSAKLKAVEDAMGKLGDLAKLIKELKLIEAKLAEQEDQQIRVRAAEIQRQVDELTNPKKP